MGGRESWMKHGPNGEPWSRVEWDLILGPDLIIWSALGPVRVFAPQPATGGFDPSPLCASPMGCLGQSHAKTKVCGK